jgi:hypothetical protein
MKPNTRTARQIAAEIMRFVRGAWGMTHDERAWFVDQVSPIIEAALKAEHEMDACERMRDAFLTELHSHVGVCGHCGKPNCSHKRDWSKLPDLIEVDVVLKAIQSAVDKAALKAEST